MLSPAGPLTHILRCRLQEGRSYDFLFKLQRHSYVLGHRTDVLGAHIGEVLDSYWGHALLATHQIIPALPWALRQIDLARMDSHLSLGHLTLNLLVLKLVYGVLCRSEPIHSVPLLLSQGIFLGIFLLRWLFLRYLNSFLFFFPQRLHLADHVFHALQVRLALPVSPIPPVLTSGEIFAATFLKELLFERWDGQARLKLFCVNLSYLGQSIISYFGEKSWSILLLHGPAEFKRVVQFFASKANSLPSYTFDVPVSQQGLLNARWLVLIGGPLRVVAAT